MIVVDDVANLLVAHGVVAVGVVLMRGRLPEQPDSLVAVTEYGGVPPRSTHDGGIRRFPRVQVIVRDPDPLTARQGAQNVFSLLLDTQNWADAALLLNGTQYEVIVPLQEPFVLAGDSHGRTMIACNYEARAGV